MLSAFRDKVEARNLQGSQDHQEKNLCRGKGWAVGVVRTHMAFLAGSGWVGSNRPWLGTAQWWPQALLGQGPQRLRTTSGFSLGGKQEHGAPPPCIYLSRHKEGARALSSLYSSLQSKQASTLLGKCRHLHACVHGGGTFAPTARALKPKLLVRVTAPWAVIK